MTTYKFLAPGRRQPFSGVALPAPGEWFDVGSDAADGPDGIRACRADQVAHWLAAELWEIELAGDPTVLPHSVVAPRARLVRPIEEWTESVSGELVENWVWRARDVLVDRLLQAGEDASADALRILSVVEELPTATRALEAGASSEWTDRLGRLADAAEDAMEVGAATALLTATVALVGWDEEAQAHERALQSEWIARRLGLSGD